MRGFVFVPNKSVGAKGKGWTMVWASFSCRSGRIRLSLNDKVGAREDKGRWERQTVRQANRQTRRLGWLLQFLPLSLSPPQELLNDVVVRSAQKFRDDSDDRRNSFEVVVGRDERSIVLQAPTNAERAAWLERMGGIGPVRTVRAVKARHRCVEFGGWLEKSKTDTPVVVFGFWTAGARAPAWRTTLPCFYSGPLSRLKRPGSTHRTFIGEWWRSGPVDLSLI